MPIVDFAQDPAESFGTGNFRDDKGRVMYLHDPETASQFNKTMPGTSVGARVGAESNAIAEREIGAPPRGPDLRLAQNDAPNESSGANPGAALVGNLASVQAPAAPSPGAPAPVAGAGAAPGAPSIPAGAPGAAPAVAGPPGAAAPPGAPGAPPGSPGAALVQGVTDYHDRVSARSQPRDVKLPEPNPRGDLPLAAVRSGEGVSVDEGRPVENVLEQLGDEAPVVQQGIDLLRQQGRDKDTAAQAGLRSQMSGQRGLYGQSVDSAFRANAELRKAESQLSKIQAEIKRNDENLDPDRYVKQMSTGKRIGMIILAALNGGFGAIIGQKNNAVLDILNAQIDRDFEKQKLEVQNRKASLGNDYKRYLDLGLDAEQAEKLWRDRASKALLDFKDLESKRVSSKGEHERAAELLVQPLRQAWVQRRGDLLKETESKVKRSRDESITHERPAPALVSPQDVLAMMAINNQKIANANTGDVEAAVGHPVTPEEAGQLRKDAQEYQKRLAVIASTRAQINAVANKVGLFKGKAGYEGTADPGRRPLGSSALDPQARAVDREYALLKRADIMQMVREPSAPLQNEFGQITARPFNDSDIAPQLNTLDRVLSDAEKELRAGFSDDALAFYRRQTAPSAPVPPAPPAKPGAAPGGKPAPASPTGGAPGGLRSE